MSQKLDRQTSDLADSFMAGRISRRTFISRLLALGLALIQSVVPVIGARRGDVALMEMARSTALAQLLFVDPVRTTRERLSSLPSESVDKALCVNARKFFDIP